MALLFVSSRILAISSELVISESTYGDMASCKMVRVYYFSMESWRGATEFNFLAISQRSPWYTIENVNIARTSPISPRRRGLEKCPPPLQTETPLDSVCVSDPISQPLGVGSFAGKGLMGKVMKWTSRELPSNQKPMSEEEKQRILEKIQPGDVLLTYASQRPNLGHLEYWTTGADYTHCALYEGYGRIIETQGDQVMRSPLIERLQGPIKVAVVRPPYKSFQDRAYVIREAKKLVGTPYDYKFDNNDPSELYCSEFIEVAMKRVDPELDVPDARFLGREITAPDGFAEMNGARLIHDGRSNYWANLTHQWPMYLGGAAGAGAGATLGAALGATVSPGLGAVIGGPVGAVLGGVLGFEGAVSATKWLNS